MWIFRRETHDLEEGADRILTQVLAPRTLSIFESKIEMAVNEYLGIKIDAPPITPIEINGAFDFILFKLDAEM